MTPSSQSKAFASVAVVLTLVAACTEKPAASTGAGPQATSVATAEPSQSAKVDAPPASSSAEPMVVPTVTSSAAAPVDAGAPKDAGAKKEKDAGAVASTSAKPDAGPAPVADLPAPAAGSADEVAQKLDNLYVPRKTYTAKFKQEYVAKVSGVTKNSTGVVWVERPNKISFRYDAPNKNRIVSDGTTLKIFVDEDQQMIQQPVSKTEYPGALAFLMGHGLRPSFTFKFNDKVTYDKGPVLYGKPRDATPYYEYVQFWVDKDLLEKADPGTITKVLIVDAQGNKNRFEFDSASQPATIDASEFTFTPPAGTDIKTSP